jgi:hypothetical protein
VHNTGGQQGTRYQGAHTGSQFKQLQGGPIGASALRVTAEPLGPVVSRAITVLVCTGAT